MSFLSTDNSGNDGLALLFLGQKLDHGSLDCVDIVEGKTERALWVRAKADEMGVIRVGKVISKRRYQTLSWGADRGPGEIVGPEKVNMDLVAPIDGLILQGLLLVCGKRWEELNGREDVERDSADNRLGLVYFAVSGSHGDDASRILNPLYWGAEAVGQVARRQGVVKDTPVQLTLAAAKPSVKSNVIEPSGSMRTQRPPAQSTEKAELIKGITAHLEQLAFQHRKLLRCEFVPNLIQPVLARELVPLSHFLGRLTRTEGVFPSMFQIVPVDVAEIAEHSAGLLSLHVYFYEPMFFFGKGGIPRVETYLFLVGQGPLIGASRGREVIFFTTGILGDDPVIVKPVVGYLTVDVRHVPMDPCSPHLIVKSVNGGVPRAPADSVASFEKQCLLAWIHSMSAMARTWRHWVTYPG